MPIRIVPRLLNLLIIFSISHRYQVELRSLQNLYKINKTSKITRTTILLWKTLHKQSFVQNCTNDETFVLPFKTTYSSLPQQTYNM